MLHHLKYLKIIPILISVGIVGCASTVNQTPISTLKTSAQKISMAMPAPNLVNNDNVTISWNILCNATILNSSNLIDWVAIDTTGTNLSKDFPKIGDAGFFRLWVTNESVKLTWDRSIDPIVSGYNVYYGSSSGAYTNVTDAGNNIIITLNGLNINQMYYFAATTYAESGMESPFSDEVIYSPPAPILTIR